MDASCPPNMWFQAAFHKPLEDVVKVFHLDPGSKCRLTWLDRKPGLQPPVNWIWNTGRVFPGHDNVGAKANVTARAPNSDGSKGSTLQESFI